MKGKRVVNNNSAAATCLFCLLLSAFVLLGSFLLSAMSQPMKIM